MQQYEENISVLLNKVSPSERKKVESDTIYKLCFNDGAMKETFGRAYGIIYGEVNSIGQMRRMVKKRRRDEE